MVSPRCILAAWRHLAVAGADRRRERRTVRSHSEGLRLRKAFDVMLAASRIRLDLEVVARIHIITNMLKRALYGWRFRVSARKASAGQKRLALKIREVYMSAVVFAEWKGVVDRHVRLKHLALCEPVYGLTPSKPLLRSRQTAKSLAEAILASQYRLSEYDLTSRFQPPRLTSSCKKPAGPQEKAHRQYLLMQQKFGEEAPPAPAPAVEWNEGTLAAARYTEMRQLMNKLWKDSDKRMTPWLTFSLWKAAVIQKKASRCLTLEYIKKLAKRWLIAVAKHTRNVLRLMDEVGVFADINTKKRAWKQWRCSIAAKYAAVERTRRRRIVKRCFRHLRKYVYERKKRMAAKLKALKHYGFSLIWKALFALCKAQRERRTATGIRAKSLFKQCFTAWRRKLKAYHLFQCLQARPIRSSAEVAALWLWWQGAFDIEHPRRPALTRALQWKWTRRIADIFGGWKFFTKRTTHLRRLVTAIRTLAYRKGLQSLDDYLWEAQENERRGWSAFRWVRLRLLLRLWRRMNSLSKRKKQFVTKRLFTAWRQAQHAQENLFAGYRRSMVLRRSWKCLTAQLVLRSKREAAKAWQLGKVAYRETIGLRRAIVTLLRNVFRRKALRKLLAKAQKYSVKARARIVIDAWKCFYFLGRKKRAIRHKADSYSQGRIAVAHYGPNEGKMIARNVFTAWKVVVRRSKTIESVIITREKRRDRKRLKGIVKAWKKATLRIVHSQIEELASLAAEKEGKRHGEVAGKKSTPRTLSFPHSQTMKSDISDEIAQLEHSIRTTLSAMAFPQSPR